MKKQTPSQTLKHFASAASAEGVIPCSCTLSQKAVRVSVIPGLLSQGTTRRRSLLLKPKWRVRYFPPGGCPRPGHRPIRTGRPPDASLLWLAAVSQEPWEGALKSPHRSLARTVLVSSWARPQIAVRSGNARNPHPWLRKPWSLANSKGRRT